MQTVLTLDSRSRLQLADGKEGVSLDLDLDLVVAGEDHQRGATSEFVMYL